MNPIAKELNKTIQSANPHTFEMLSEIGKSLFFPKGILSQSAEAKEKAYKFNATIGMAAENKKTMYLKSVVRHIESIEPENFLTYAPSFGLLELRKKWKEDLFKKNRSINEKKISLPITTCGVTQAISIFADLWIDKDDVVILPDMTWGNYNMIFNIRHGARISSYSMFTCDMKFNLPAFEAVVVAEAEKHDKIAVLLSFPHNPTGYTVSEKEGEQIIKILRDTVRSGTKVIVFTDDAYFGMFYEDNTFKESFFASLCDLDPSLLAVKLDGATKESFAWGLRVGFITYGTKLDDNRLLASFYDAIERKTAGGIRGNISSASLLSQAIVLQAMNDKNFNAEKKEKIQILKNRAERVKKVLNNPKYKEAWDVYPFNSGYFMCLRLKTVNAGILRVHLLDNYGVGLIAIDDKNLRVAFSCIDESDIPALFDTVFNGIKDLEENKAKTL